MNPDRLLSSQWPNRALYIFWMVGSVIAGFLLTRVDLIVNGTLYSYGLQFSYDWANPYWTYIRVVDVLLIVSVSLSAFALALDLARSRKLSAASVAEVSVKAPEVHVEDLEAKEDAKLFTEADEVLKGRVEEMVKPKKMPVEEPKAKDGNNILTISCPSCKKAFSRPLVMLDFSGGLTKLVNICPYCNHILGVAEAEHQKSEDDNVQVSSMDEEMERSSPFGKKLPGSFWAPDEKQA